MSCFSFHYQPPPDSDGTGSDASLPKTDDDEGWDEYIRKEVPLGTITIVGDAEMLSTRLKKESSIGKTRLRTRGKHRLSMMRRREAAPSSIHEDDEDDPAGIRDFIKETSTVLDPFEQGSKKGFAKDKNGKHASVKSRRNPYQKFRDKNMEKFKSDRMVWERRELAALAAAPVSKDVVGRVIVVRHGMGKHNDLKGAFSYMNRDAMLNEIGIEQAKETGMALKSGGVFDNVDLVVVSPFRRTIQTANYLFGRHFSNLKAKTVLQPLCAEHTFNWSAIQQGDRGSTPEELAAEFPKLQFPQYDFEDIHRYCNAHGVTDFGAWWHHGKKAAENHRGFKKRSMEFKRWLGAQMVERKAKLVVVSSHGGFLSTAFGLPKLHNCEFRVFDMLPDGRFFRVAKPRPTGPDAPLKGRYRAPRFQLYTLHKGPKISKHRYYDVCGVYDGNPFRIRRKLSTIRSELYGSMKSVLCGKTFISTLGAEAYAADSSLQDVIHTFPNSSRKAVKRLIGWFQALTIVLDRDYMPPALLVKVAAFLSADDGINKAGEQVTEIDDDDSDESDNDGEIDPALLSDHSDGAGV